MSTLQKQLRAVRTTCAARLLPLLLLTLPAVVRSQDYTWTTNNGTITITRYTGAGGDVTIPDKITGLPVTSIGDKAFLDCFRLRNVTLGTNITSIGDYAFFFCSSLASVSITNRVAAIGEGAFYNCTGLTNLSVPSSVTNVGYMAFWFCTNLNYTKIPNIGANKAATAVTKTHWRNLSSSYADVFVEPFLPQFGFACEVGANDGIRESDTLLFEKKGWTVLCIEPNPLLTVALSQNRKLWRAVACGSERADDMEFVICGVYPYDSSSGFHTGTGAYPCPNPKIVHVKVLPLRDVLEDVKFPRLDLLTIDVEGHELEVLKGMDFTRWHPKFVIVEDTHDADAIAKYLKSLGYESWAHRLTDNIYGLSSLRGRPSR
jgi:FkbM family methyltransferase